MAKTKPSNGNEKTAVRLAFIAWLALPEPLRDPKTQGAFAEKHKVRDATLSDWKKDEKLWEEVSTLTKNWGRDKMPNVMMALYQGILKNKRAAEAQLWMEWAAGFSKKVETEAPALSAEVEKLRLTLKQMIEAVKQAGKR